MLKRLRLSITALCAISIITALFFSWYGARLVENSNQAYIIQSNKVSAKSIASSAEQYMQQLFAAANINIESSAYQADLQLLNRLDALFGTQIIDSPIKAVVIRNRSGTVLYASNMLSAKEVSADSFTEDTIASIDSLGEQGISTQLSRASGEPIFVTYVPISIHGHTEPVGILSIKTQHLVNFYQTESAKRQIYWMISASTLIIVVLILLLGKYLQRRYNQDYSAYKTLEAQHRHLVQHDLVTGLVNRQSFINKLDEFANECESRHYSNFAVFVMDIDHFKTVNESIGHRAGNQLIQEASVRIKNCLQDQGAVIARLGGDEFGIIMQNMNDLQNATSIAKKLLSQFRAPFRIEEKEISVSLSIGVVICQGDQVIAEEVMRDADIAMYRAKQNGRGCYELFNPHMHVEAMERIEIEKDIKRGIANNEIFNRYQPIVDLHSNVTHSLEALARWQHPEKGELTPNYFIPIAEETGLIHGIDKRVLRLALQDLVSWQQSMASLRNLSVSVNHSARNFSSRPTMDNIYRNLAESHMSGRNLKIELTESSIIDNESLAFSMFEELRSKGIHLCMDDFGTGFSSLSYLRKLNFDMLKIDMSFVRDMVDDIDARKIVQTMIDMGNNLGIAVTAEGVEDKEQLDLLVNMGCRYAQGYLFSRPMLAADVLPYIKAQMQERKEGRS